MQFKETLHKLQELGFKEYESKVFLVLLNGTALSATEIAKRAEVSRTSVYQILKSFAEKGFCNEIETNTILKYEIIDPRVIADKIEREINLNKEKKLESLKTTFSKLEEIRKSADVADDNNVNIELIRGFNKHRQTKFIELFNKAEKEILFMIRLEGYVSEELDSGAKAFFRKGGIIKSIYEASLDFKIIKDNSRQDATIEDLIRICKRFEKSGEQLRISRHQIPNMTIFDRRTVFINVQDKTVPRHNNADIIVKNEDFAGRMIDLFNYYWERALSPDSITEAWKNFALTSKSSIKKKVLNKV